MILQNLIISYKKILTNVFRQFFKEFKKKIA